MNMPKCIICGQPVTPETGVIAGALGKPLRLRGRALIYHEGDCAELFHGAARMLGRGALRLMQLRAPNLLAFASRVLGRS